jgi:uncharacterized protein with NAD-binding domain and iron-sulfur cluster
VASGGQRTKVAILGGGVGAITAAFALTSTEELRDTYDITVHVCGFRLGGKGASGRNAALGHRIEEHGLHIWFGFYDNAFRLMRQCYEELGRPAGTPLATLEDAFAPHQDVVLWGQQGERWVGRCGGSSANPLPPGSDHEWPTFWEIVEIAVHWLRTSWEGLAEEKKAPAPAHHVLPGWAEDLAKDIDADLHGALHLGEHLFRLIERLAHLRQGIGWLEEPHHFSVMTALLKEVRHWAWAVVGDQVEQDPELRWWFCAVDVGVTVITGILEDRLLERGFGAVDDEELCEWLGRHGAMPITLGTSFATRAVIVRSLYDMAFAFMEGDITQPALAAGTCVHGALRLMLTYRGALYWKMQAGMGDTIFMPYYEVLCRRGVKFEFFQWVSRLGLNADRTEVAEIEIVPQVELREEVRQRPGGYDPSVTVNDLKCWPSEPCWDQIEHDPALPVPGRDLEGGPGPLHLDKIVLRAGQDFDQVVLGISVAGLPPICTELASDPGNPRFAAMLSGTPTVATQAFQVWMTRSAPELGWAEKGGELSGAFVEPLDTYCDMSQLLVRETWPAGNAPASVAYFCGVIRDIAGETPDQADERARESALQFLADDAPWLWPASVDPNGGKGVSWSLVYDPNGGEGEDRFARQYWRANIGGSERYVLSPPKVIKNRLAADQSGYRNLFLAGDWTDTGLNVGCVEAATMSGLQAARALSGTPFVVVGENHTWLVRKAGS